MQTVERLELPSDTYHALEEIARFQGIPPARVVENLIRQYYSKESLRTLRKEYRELIHKDLMQVITREEEQRLEAVCSQINEIERQSEINLLSEERANEIENRFDLLERKINALPDL